MKKYIFLIIGALFIFALDQWTKVWAVEALVGSFDAMNFADDGRVYIKAHRSIPIFEGWWHHRLVGNTGAAFGIFRTLPQGLRIPFFFVITVVAISMMTFLYRSAEKQPLLRVAITLILGGAIGNLYDRLQHSFVIDCIVWFIPCTTEGSIQRQVIDFFAPCRGLNHHWPTFNVADIAISVGIGLFLIDALFFADKNGAADASKKEAPESQ